MSGGSAAVVSIGSSHMDVKHLARCHLEGACHLAAVSSLGGTVLIVGCVLAFGAEKLDLDLLDAFRNHEFLNAASEAEALRSRNVVTAAGNVRKDAACGRIAAILGAGVAIVAVRVSTDALAALARVMLCACIPVIAAPVDRLVHASRGHIARVKGAVLIVITVDARTPADPTRAGIAVRARVTIVAWRDVGDGAASIVGIATVVGTDVPVIA